MIVIIHVLYCYIACHRQYPREQTNNKAYFEANNIINSLNNRKNNHYDTLVQILPRFQV